jgi:hypothetical protein
MGTIGKYQFSGKKKYFETLSGKDAPGCKRPEDLKSVSERPILFKS